MAVSARGRKVSPWATPLRTLTNEMGSSGIQAGISDQGWTPRSRRNGKGTQVNDTGGREAALEQIKTRRIAHQPTELEPFFDMLKTCIRCYNCREVCPICYCKECLLTPEKMGYTTNRHLLRAKKKGKLTMPVDTMLYHLTKMNHMASSCVACGVCEQACPMDIPLGSIFGRVGRNVQALFDYVPGRSLEEELPVTTFKEEELPQAEDIKR